MELSDVKKPILSFSAKVTLKLMVVVGVLLAANMLAFNQQASWDASEGKIHSLAQSTVDLLKAVHQPVKVLAFMSRWDRTHEDLLGRFRAENPAISYQFINPEEQKPLAEKYDVKDAGVIVVEMGKSQRRMRVLKEQNLAGAIMQLGKGAGKRIVFTSGHGELDLDGAGPLGLASANRLLGTAGYVTVQDAPTDKALSGAAAAVIAGPEADLSAEETARLRAFVERGGGLLVLYREPPASTLEGLVQPYGVGANDDQVIEPVAAFQVPKMGARHILFKRPLVAHPLSERIVESFFLSYVRSLTMDISRAKAKEILALFYASKRGWGETRYREQIVGRDPKDNLGTRVMVIATPEPPSIAGKGRILVAGTASFAQNRYINGYGNRGFFEAAVSWLSGDLGYPLVAQKEATRKLDLSEEQLRTVLVVCVLVLPGIFAVLGLTVFIRRAE